MTPEDRADKCFRNGTHGNLKVEITQAIRLAVEAEREACALIVEECYNPTVGKEIAYAIRERVG